MVLTGRTSYSDMWAARDVQPEQGHTPTDTQMTQKRGHLPPHHPVARGNCIPNCAAGAGGRGRPAPPKGIRPEQGRDVRARKEAPSQQDTTPGRTAEQSVLPPWQRKKPASKEGY
jgi:hypothetical protein